MKRFLALTLVILTVLSAVSLVAAYEGPNTSVLPSEWHAALNLGFNNKSASPLKDFEFKLDMTADQTDQATTGYYRRGAIELYNKTTFDSKDTGLYRRAFVEAAQPDTTDHGFVTLSETTIGDKTVLPGSTLDFGLQLRDLTTVDNALLQDDGTLVVSGPVYKAGGLLGRYAGFVLDLRSVAEYRDQNGDPKVVGGSNAATEFILSFVNYENATTGTHQAIIFLTGSASSISNRVQSKREVYFCNLDVGSSAAYHRYTLSTDYTKCGTGENLVTLYIDGEKATTFTAPAYSNYSSTDGDHLTLGCYNTNYDAAALDGPVTTFAYVDQLSVYGTCLTPSGSTPCVFAETAPLYTEDFLTAYSAAKSLDETEYSKKSWAPIAEVFAECEPVLETLDRDHVTQAQLDGWQSRLNEAIADLRYNTFDSSHATTKRLYIPFAYHSDTDAQGPMNSYAYAWTNSAILFNNPNYDITTYSVNGMKLVDWTSLVCEPTGNPDEFTITHFYPAGTPLANREANTVPEDGFILYVHVNVPGTSSSYYASQLFADNNAEVLSQLEEGMTVTLENTVLNPNGTATPNTAAALTKNGDFWRSRYDPDVISGTFAPTSSGDTCEAILAKYPPSGSVSWRDYFNGFETTSAIALQLPYLPYLDEYNAIEARIAALNEANYTAESWAALQTALQENPALDLESADLTQDMIDARADALKAAYDALVRKDAASEQEDDSKNSNISTDTGDHVVFIVLGVIAVLAVICAAVLVVGKKRGNF